MTYIFGGGGILVILGGLIYFGRRLQILDDLKKICDELVKKTTSVDNRVSNIEGRMGIGYTSANSPVRLTSKGMQILNASGAKTIVENEENKKKILDIICSEPKPKTSYDVQEKTKKIINDLSNDTMFIPLKDYAFSQGIDLAILLNIVAIYFRDIALEHCGYKTEDLK